MTTISDRIKRLLKDRNINSKDLSNISGVPPATISVLLNGKVKDVKADTLSRIARALGVNMSWLYTGRSDSDSLIDVTDSYAPVHIYNVHYDIASGDVIYTKSPDYHPLLLSTSFFKRYKTDIDFCRAFLAVGDSMEPSIVDGDTVIVDCSDNNQIRNGAPYAVICANNPDLLQVKVLRQKFDRTLIIHSINTSKYEDETVAPEQLKFVRIVGRVIAIFSTK